MVDLGAIWVKAMRAGRHRAAWGVSARVLRARDPATRDDPALPYHRRWVWNGEAVDGRAVLVRCYQGLGDTLMFARFLPLLAARAAHVTVEAPAALVPLLRQVGNVAVRPFDLAHPSPRDDLDVEICELGFALRAAPADAPPPYLAARPAALPANAIGVCHTTGPWDEARRLPAALLAPLCRRRLCVALMPGPTALRVLNPGGCPPAIENTARLIAGLSLVVTVDTMVAHLAGALGRPVWLLLKHEPDWRWVPHAGTSAWYPTMRTFTQPTPGDWAGTMAAVERALDP